MKQSIFFLFILLSIKSTAQKAPTDSLVLDQQIFTKVEKEPQPPLSWQEFLKGNLNTPKVFKNNAPVGTYTVVIRFVVWKDGSISDFAAETKVGYGLEQECMRVLKLSPKWIPALQNDRQVNCYKRQAFNFVSNE
ncbi:energy transducer TonB [Ferruginibacter albus]|uniref:energy transducer TonB n=1 Tax=Ferruginibacter albus TaxID=2875540 RepID=UPI001CC535B2|nr:energy transducer TonB [Ferruginibacter albus]UAY50652.1 energy transducer TonB [Ferruginibacter albus]